MTSDNDAFDRIPRRRAVVPPRDNSYLPASEATTELIKETKDSRNSSSIKRSTEIVETPKSLSLENSFQIPSDAEELLTVTIRVTKGLNEQTKQCFQPSFKKGNFSTFVQAAFEILFQSEDEAKIRDIKEIILEKSNTIAERRAQEGKRKRVLTMYDNEMKNL